MVKVTVHFKSLILGNCTHCESASEGTNEIADLYFFGRDELSKFCTDSQRMRNNRQVVYR